MHYCNFRSVSNLENICKCVVKDFTCHLAFSATLEGLIEGGVGINGDGGVKNSLNLTNGGWNKRKSGKFLKI